MQLCLSRDSNNSMQIAMQIYYNVKYDNVASIHFTSEISWFGFGQFSLLPQIANRGDHRSTGIIHLHSDHLHQELSTKFLLVSRMSNCAAIYRSTRCSKWVSFSPLISSHKYTLSPITLHKYVLNYFFATVGSFVNEVVPSLQKLEVQTNGLSYLTPTYALGKLYNSAEHSLTMEIKLGWQFTHNLTRVRILAP